MEVYKNSSVDKDENCIPYSKDPTVRLRSKYDKNGVLKY